MTIDPRFSPGFVRDIEILAFPVVQLLDVAGPLQVFACANEIAIAAGRPAPYRLRVVAPGGGVVTASAGVGLAVEPLPGADAPLDTLVVAGGSGVYPACDDADLVAWVAARAPAARRVASVCSGAFLLAAAGLLDGRRVATHWSRCAQLAQRFPAVRVEPDPIFVRDGHVWTSAGITAGIDLALALVEEDCGRALALAVARQLVVFLKRPGGQAQFSATLGFQHRGGCFELLHAWMADHVAGDLTVPALARQAGMSERSFMRKYRAATGQTPSRAVERLRVETARRMLEDTPHAVKRVASQCGFGSEETMRRSFLRLVDVTPSDYRERFASARSDGEPAAAGTRPSATR